VNGDWTLDRTAGLVRKHIDGEKGWTIVAGVRIPFRVDGNRLRYPFPLVDELAEDGADAYTGTARVLGVPVGRFRMQRRRIG
jgi:hypothetical protein